MKIAIILFVLVLSACSFVSFGSNKSPGYRRIGQDSNITCKNTDPLYIITDLAAVVALVYGMTHETWPEQYNVSLFPIVPGYATSFVLNATSYSQCEDPLFESEW